MICVGDRPCAQSVVSTALVAKIAWIWHIRDNFGKYNNIISNNKLLWGYSTKTLFSGQWRINPIKLALWKAFPAFASLTGNFSSFQPGSVFLMFFPYFWGWSDLQFQYNVEFTKNDCVLHWQAQNIITSVWKHCWNNP